MRLTIGGLACLGILLVLVLPSAASWLPVPAPVQELVCVDGTMALRTPLYQTEDNYPYVFNCLDIGIRPGAMTFSGVHRGCTMNFIFTDGTNLYFGMAAHCVSIGADVKIYGEGIVGKSVFRANVEDNLDPIDFALVRIDPAKHGRVNPAVAFWGGPTGLATERSPDTVGSLGVKSYGQGLGFHVTPQTRPRVGFMYEWRDNVVIYGMTTINGDSGAPILTADGLALASHIGGVSPPPLGRGFQIARGIQLAEASLGVDLELVTAPLNEVSNAPLL